MNEKIKTGINQIQQIDMKKYITGNFTLVINYLPQNTEVDGEIIIFNKNGTFYNKSQNTEGIYKFIEEKNKLLIIEPFNEYYLYFFQQIDNNIFITAVEDKEEKQGVIFYCKHYGTQINKIFDLFDNKYQTLKENMFFNKSFLIVNDGSFIKFKENKMLMFNENEFGGKEITEFDFYFLKDDNTIRFTNKIIDGYFKVLEKNLKTEKKESESDIILIDTAIKYKDEGLLYFNLLSLKEL